MAQTTPVVTVAAGAGLTDAQLRAAPVPVSGPLTDAQLRATAIPVSGAGTSLADLQPNGVQADQRLTVDDTAGGKQFAAFHADTTHIIWSNEDAQIRVTFDGSAPTSTNGHIIELGDSGLWIKALAVAAKFIRTGGTSGVIHASQLKI